jgi:hypothetical protein
MLWLIPIAVDADWYVPKVAAAAAREINKTPAGRPSPEESISRPVGMNQSRRTLRTAQQRHLSACIKPYPC